MNTIDETFAPGDMVVWREQEDDELRGYVRALREMFGEGPFRIVRVVRSVPGQPQELEICLNEFTNYPKLVYSTLIKHVRH